ncbi:MAG TPA: hypothetical protein VGR14_03745 [Verrucomicrobiae bacterium]|jgi:hypothetical protein|nr:hypothetical protein [Verrucomicrobiae bacterium]
MPRFDPTVQATPTAPIAPVQMTRWRTAAAPPAPAAPTLSAPPAAAPAQAVASPPTPAPSTAAAPSKPKLNFGSIKKKDVKVVAEYPVLPDLEGTNAQYATAFLKAQAEEEAAKGAKEAARGELVRRARDFHFKINAGKAAIPSSVSILALDGEEVRVTFKEKYKAMDEEKLAAIKTIIGAEMADKYLVEKFVFKIESDKIPADKMQGVIDAVNALAGTHCIADAVSVTSCYEPNSEWHTARFRELSDVQNIDLEFALDGEKGFCQISVGAARGKK